jgi:hypothetical protein
MTALAWGGLALVLATTTMPAAPGAPSTQAAPAAPQAAPATAAKLAPAAGKEMQDAIVSVNKSLGLESWPQHGAKPCIDRGGQGILAKEVTPEDARKCAAAAVDKGLPLLGKSYVLAILMGEIGPVTVIAVGTGEAAGCGAYSCDPTRACKPLKIVPTNKWGKRLGERQAKACGEATTIWFPAGQRVCAADAK